MQKRNFASFVKRIKIFLNYIKPYKKELKIFAALSILDALLFAVTPFLIGKFFDSLTLVAGGADPYISGAFVFLALWFVLQVTVRFIAWNSRLIITKIEYRSDAEFNAMASRFLFSMPMSFHKEERSGAIAHKLEKAAARLGYFINLIFNQYAASLIGIITGTFMAFYISYKLASVMLLGMLVYAVVGVVLTKDLAKKQKQGQSAWKDAYSEIFNSLSNIFAIKSFSQEEFKAKLIWKKFERAWKRWSHPERIWASVNFAQAFIVALTQLSIFLFSIYLLQSAEITVGDVVAINAYVLAAFGPLVMFMNQFSNLQNGLILIEEANKLLSKRTENYTPKNPCLPKRFTPSVEFKDVYFRYSKKDPLVLVGVSFKADPMQKVALVGGSGGGKTTSVDLISAYIFPNKGKVLVSGKSTKCLPLKYLREHITIVPQETVLFNDTLKNNLLIAKPNAKEEELWQALEKAQLKDFVESLPKKLKSKVGERGVKLSVGQKQRLSIARAFLRNTPILIMDEPTSALDAKTESELQKVFDELFKNKTVFIIAHRLATVKKADQILVFDKGKIVEEGRHEDLIQKEGGVYKELYELQKL